jgi:hypothetical protein
VSKKYKGGNERDKKGIEKMHKENEKMYEEFLETTEQISIVKENFKKKESANLGKELLDAMNDFEELEDTIYSFLEKKDVIDKKYLELERISMLSSLNRNTLQNVIKDLDTVFESFVLDTNKIYDAINQNVSLILKLQKNNGKAVIKNKEIINLVKNFETLNRHFVSNIEELFNIIKNKQDLIDNVNNLKDTINSNKSESINTANKTTEMPYINEILDILEQVSNHNKYDSLYSIEFIIKYLIIFNNYQIDDLIGLYDNYEIEILIKYGYQKENENFDTWINGSSNDLVELKKLVSNNNTNLKFFKKNMNTDFLSLTTERATQIKKAEEEAKKTKDEDEDEDEDKNENEVNFLIETYPDSLDFFKNPKPAVFTNYTTRVTKKQNKKIKRGIDEVNNRLATLTHYKKIKDWGPKQSKNIKATIGEKGEITVL